MQDYCDYEKWTAICEMKYNEMKWMNYEWNIQQQQTNTFQNFYLDKEPRLQSNFKKIHT